AVAGAGDAAARRRERQRAARRLPRRPAARERRVALRTTRVRDRVPGRARHARARLPSPGARRTRLRYRAPMTGSLHDRPGAEVSPYLVDLSESLLYGDIWERPQLSKRDRSLVTVGVLIALNRQPELREHLGRAL